LIAGFVGWFGWLLPLVSVFGTLVVALAPFAGVVVVLWGIGAFAASVDQGSFTPVGVFAMQIWNLAAGVVSVLVGVAMPCGILSISGDGR